LTNKERTNDATIWQPSPDKNLPSLSTNLTSLTLS
jgi:hypothetical protein